VKKVKIVLIKKNDKHSIVNMKNIKKKTLKKFGLLKYDFVLRATEDKVVLKGKKKSVLKKLRKWKEHSEKMLNLSIFIMKKFELFDEINPSMENGIITIDLNNVMDSMFKDQQAPSLNPFDEGIQGLQRHIEMGLPSLLPPIFAKEFHNVVEGLQHEIFILRSDMPASCFVIDAKGDSMRFIKMENNDFRESAIKRKVGKGNLSPDAAKLLKKIGVHNAKKAQELNRLKKRSSKKDILPTKEEPMGNVKYHSRKGD